jgi:hypothetical protein
MMQPGKTGFPTPLMPSCFILIILGIYGASNFYVPNEEVYIEVHYGLRATISRMVK